MTEVANGKAAKFKDLAEKRVTKTLNGIRQISNLSNRAGYDYRPDQVSKIFKTIREAVDAAEDRFNQSSKTAQRSFMLD